MRTMVFASFNCERDAEHVRELGLAIGLCQEQDAGIEPAVMQDGVFGIARCEQRLELGAAPDRFVGELSAIHATRHDHVGEQEVDRSTIFDDLQRLDGIGRCERGAAEACDLGHHS